LNWPRGFLVALLVSWGATVATLFQGLLTSAMVLPIVAGGFAIGVVAAPTARRRPLNAVLGPLLAAVLYAALAHAVRFAVGDRPAAIDYILSIGTWAAFTMAATVLVHVVMRGAH